MLALVYLSHQSSHQMRSNWSMLVFRWEKRRLTGVSLQKNAPQRLSALFHEIQGDLEGAFLWELIACVVLAREASEYRREVDSPQAQSSLGAHDEVPLPASFGHMAGKLSAWDSLARCRAAHPFHSAAT